MKKVMTMVVTFMVLLLAFGTAFAREQKVHKEFDGFKAIRLSTVSGDCVIKTHDSDKIEIDLTYDVRPEGAFDYSVDKRGSKLVIKEEWDNADRGKVLWVLTVPKGTEISYSTASGDISATGPIGDFDARTASGDIELENVKGDVSGSTASGDIYLIDCKGKKKVSTASGDIQIEDSDGDMRCSTASGDIEGKGLSGEVSLSTASGDVDISSSKGIFELTTASGSVEASDITIEGSSRFSTASGDVTVALAASSEYDLALSTASGSVTLDYNGNPVKGYFEFEARKRSVRIVCPFDFDDETEFERHGDTYMRKTFTMKGDTPEIILHTASGTARLKK